MSESHVNMTTPFAVEKLHSHPCDNSNEIHASEIINLSQYCQKYMLNGRRVLSKMPRSVFRQCLVNHFHIRFTKNDIIWPKRIRMT